MTVWSPVEAERRVVAVWNWAGGGEHHLSLELGRVLLVRAQTEKWYYGELLTDEEREEDQLEGDGQQGAALCVGIFPKSCVRALPQEQGGGDSARALCVDIARALRAWCGPWRALFVAGGSGGAQFKFVEVSVRALLELRGEAGAGPPVDALRRLRRTAVFSMDRGDRALGRPLAVRDDLLRPVSPLGVRAAELLALHEQTEARVARNKEPPPGAVRTATSHCVLLRVSHVVCRATGGAAGDRTELRLALYRGERALTENVCVRCPARGVLAAAVVFCELSAEELRERIHLVCHVVRLGDMEPRPVSMSGGGAVTTGARGGSDLLRRPCGVAVLDVTRHLAPPVTPAPPHLEDDKEIFLPFYPCEKDSMESLLRKVLSGRATAETGSGVWGAVRREAGDVREVCARSPLLTAPSVARRLVLSELAAPGDARNDLYVRLVGGSFAGQRNVEVTARVWGPGGPLTGALAGADSYSSLVYYHEERPRWQELFAVRLSPDEFRGASLVLELRHRGSSPARDRTFALSYLRLVQVDGTATRDDEHALCVYRYEPRRTPRELVAALLDMPSRRGDPPADVAVAPLTLLPKDVLLVATQLCSTKLTYREEILGVLRWRSASSERQVCASLRALLDAPDRELVKFLQDVLDAVFDILTETYRPEQVELAVDDDEHSDAAGPLALSCVLRVTGLVSEHQFAQFRAPLDGYVQAGFCNPLAAGPLLRLAAARVERGLRARADDERAGRRLLRLARGLPYLLRFAARSRDLRAELAARGPREPHDRLEGHRDDHDALATDQLLARLADVMSRADSGALLVQGSVLKYLPQCAPALLQLLPASRVSSALVTLLSRLPAARLPTQRAHALLELARGPLLVEPESRRALLPHVAATLRTFLLQRLENEDRGEDAAARRSADKLARVLGEELVGEAGERGEWAARGAERGGHGGSLWRAQVDVCAGVVADLVALLPARREWEEQSEGDRVDGEEETDRELLCRELLPPLVRIVLGREPGAEDGRRGGEDRESSSGDEEEEEEVAAGEVATNSPEEEGARRRLVAALLDLLLASGPRELRGVLNANPGRVQRERPARDLVRVSRALWIRPCFPPHWAAMLRLQAHALLNGLRSLVTVIAQEIPPRASPRLWRDWCSAVMSTADGAPPSQARRTAARLARDTWTGLPASQRVALLPDVVGPQLSLSLLPDPVVRATCMPLFHDMMLLELQEEPTGRIDKVENELIEQLDEAVSAGAGDAAWRAEFVSVVGGLCAGQGGAGRVGLALVAAGGRQIDALLALRAARGAGEQRAALAGLLRLYGELERPALRARCLARLAELHLAAAAPAPAGLALRAQADLLPLGGDRERLQRRAACLLAQGKLWEAAAELRTRLLSGLRDYGALADEHAALAELYSQARSSPRAPPAYYRVVHRGRLIPAPLRAPSAPHGLVHAGGECELLSEFSARVLHEWPGAELLHTLDDRPDLDLLDSHFLQINAVEPVSGREEQCDDRVPEELRLHLLHHDVSVFRYSRPVKPPAFCADDTEVVNEFAARWLERTELRTAETLPAPLGWSCVLESHTRLVSPLEVALETMRDANSQLRALVLRLRARPELPLAPLTMRMAGVLDAAVMGGVEQYERAFLDEDAPPPAVLPGERHLVAGRLSQLKDLIACQVPLLQAALQLHGILAPPALADLHDHLRRRLQLHAARVHRRYGRRACTLPEYRPPQTELARNDADPAPAPAPPPKNLFTSLARYSGGPAQFSTMQHGGKRRDKRRPRRSEVVSAGPAASSQWYTAGTGPGSGSGPGTADGPGGGSQRGSSSSASLADLLNNNAESTTDMDSAATSPLRELTQELSATRPLRAEAEREVRERRLSQRPLSIQSCCSTVAGNRNSAGTTDSTPSEEEQSCAPPPPPPPPLPHKTRCEQVVPAPTTTRYNYDTVLSPRGSFLYTSLQQKRADPRAPTPPPKKKHNK